MRKFLFALTALTLTACMDVEAGFDLTNETSKMVMRMSHQMIQMSEDDFQGDCDKDGGEYSVGKEYASCAYTRAISVDEWIEQGFVTIEGMIPADPEEDLDNAFMIAVEDAGWGKVKLTLDVKKLLNDAAKDSPEQDVPPEMMEMALAAMAGHGFNFTFTGRSVAETNGEVSQDGKTVSFFIPLTDLMDKENKVAPDTYTAIVKY